MVKSIGSSSRSQLRGEEGRSSSPENDRSSEKKYTGVRKRKWGKWVSEIRLPNSRERIWLGSFDSPEKAARAFDAAQFCLRGHTAKFNFPHAPPEIPGGRTMSPPEIQLAAARFADSSPIPPAENNSPCGSSEGTAPLEGSFNELLALDDNTELLTRRMDSGNFAADYGIFPGFDELNNGFLATPPDQISGGGPDYFVDDGLDGGFGQDYYSNSLWNF